MVKTVKLHWPWLDMLLFPLGFILQMMSWKLENHWRWGISKGGATGDVACEHEVRNRVQKSALEWGWVIYCLFRGEMKYQLCTERNKVLCSVGPPDLATQPTNHFHRTTTRDQRNMYFQNVQLLKYSTYTIFDLPVFKIFIFDSKPSQPFTMSYNCFH